METNQRYEDFVMRSVRTQRSPRTLHEAYRDGEYGYSIYLFKDDVSHAWDFFKESFAWFLVMMAYGSGLYAFCVWVGLL